MGNSSCCSKIDSLTLQMDKKNYVEIHNMVSPSDRHKISIDYILKIQKYWRGYKSRCFLHKIKAEKKYIFEKIPGLELSANQIINRSTALIEETEKKLGIFGFKKKQSEIIILNDNQENNSRPLRQTSLLYPDNTIYIGTFNYKWEKHGLGTLFTRENAKITGYFKDDKLNGNGRIIYPEGDYFEGNFIDDKLSGYGEYVNTEGIKYKGEWKDDMKNGLGEEINPDGTIFIGDFINDLKNGFGKFLWGDGTLYEGNLIKNQIEGIGKMIFFDKQFYKGEWKANKIEGKGIFFWPDNKVYIGNYKNEKKWGYGIFIWPNGKRYEGQWLNGKQHGFGICYWNNKKQLSEWRLGKKQKMVNETIDDMKNKIIQINTNILESINFCKSIGLEIDANFTSFKIDEININIRNSQIYSISPTLPSPPMVIINNS